MNLANILIVEDEERLQQVLARTLEQSGYTVHTAVTAEQAIQTVRDQRPDLLVLDINLPDSTGWDLLRRLEAQGITCANLHTIIISATHPDHRRLARFRPVVFLAKPFAISTLRRLIEGALVDIPC
ncbi:MAG: response regulator [Chloroflexota bacterium]